MNNPICNYKCALTFNYNDSYLTITNKKFYLLLDYEKTNTKQVIFNNNPYAVSEIRIYSPSIFHVGNNKSDGEIFIIHQSENSSENLIIVIPLVNDNKSGQGTTLLDTIINISSRQTRKQNDTYNTNITGFNLNNIIPKTQYYSYDGPLPWNKMSTNNHYVEFDRNRGGYLSISTEAKGHLKKILDSYTSKKCNNIPNKITDTKDYINNAFKDIQKLTKSLNTKNKKHKEKIRKRIIDKEETIDKFEEYLEEQQGIFSQCFGIDISHISYNKLGPTELNDTNEIYIDCKPVEESTTKKETVMYDKITNSSVNKSAIWVGDNIFPIVLAILVFYMLFKGFQNIFGLKKNNSKDNNKDSSSKEDENMNNFFKF